MQCYPSVKKRIVKTMVLEQTRLHELSLVFVISFEEVSTLIFMLIIEDLFRVHTFISVHSCRKLLNGMTDNSRCARYIL